MWREIFFFELDFRLKQLSTYIFGIILFLFGFLLVNILGGAFSAVSVSIISGGERVFLNSAFVNTTLMERVSIFLIFIIASFVSSMLSRDMENKAYYFFFTKPISKWSYITARFFANMLLVGVINLMMVLGMFIAFYMPWIEGEYFMKPQLLNYLTPLTHIIIPNIILIGSILLGVFLITKKSAYVYVASFFILTAYLIGRNYIGNIENRLVASLIDPFGISALSEVTRLWSVAQRNTQPIPLIGLLLWNRIIWVGIGIIILCLCVVKFNLKWISTDNSKTKKASKKIAVPEDFVIPPIRYGLTTSIRQFFTMLTFNLRLIFKSFPLYLLTICGIAFTVLIVIQHGTIYNTRTLPVTYNVAEAIALSIPLLMFLIITLYTGELSWKSKDFKYDGFLDSTPTSNLSFYLSKLTALIILQIFLLTTFIVAGLVYQTARGYTEYELNTYISLLFGINMPYYIIATILCLFIHEIIGNKYAAHFVFIAIFLLQPLTEQMGLHHTLLQFNTTPRVVFSDINSLGNNLTGYIWFTIYWSFLAILIVYFTVINRRRGKNDFSFQRLWGRMKYRNNYIFAVVILFLFVLTGGYIFYNTNVLNAYMSPKRAERAAAEFERKFSEYADLAQPKITDVNLKVDIYPCSRDIHYQGTYSLQNKTADPIQEIHVMVPCSVEKKKLLFDREHRLTVKDEDFGYYIFEFTDPLMPNELINLDFAASIISRGFSLSENSFINKNGTFIHSTYFPSIGYNDRFEILSPRTRKRYDLPDKKPFREIDDPAGLSRNYVSHDADWITYEAVISTSEEQTVLTSGDLIRNWSDGGRNYFHYKLNGIMVNYYAILSAKYSVQKEIFNDIDIEIYYHDKHDYNIDRMMNGVKQSLTYYENAFGPYPHNVLRIAEFPRYGSFAQSLATLIPFSESIGFIADIRKDKVDYPFMVTAHEVAHQWWVHQVIGANVKGALTLAEAITQYSALMVMKNEFSRDLFRQQLLYDLTRYLAGRSSESREENPVYLDEGQQYIHYSKGAMVFYGLSQYIGEDTLNNALKRFVADKRYQEPPYTTTLELFEYINIPDSLQYLLDDSFMKITLYDNSIKDAVKTKNDDGTYTVNAVISTAKYYSDGLGNTEKAELNDWIEVVVYDRVFGGGGSISRPIYSEYLRFTEEETELSITVSSNPTKIGIDPDYKLINMMPYNNTIELK